VEVIKRNDGMDWAILQVRGSFRFIPIPISCTAIPREAKLKVYHCPASMYNTNDIDIVSAFPQSVYYWTSSSHHIVVSGGLFQGSSGAPFLLASGHVVAIHVEGANEATSPADIKNASTGTAMSEGEIISESLNSVLCVHASLSKGLKISQCPMLIKELTALGIELHY
jgi:hypothetical protein